MRRVHVIDGYDRMGGEIYYRHEDKARIMADPELREAFMLGEKCGYKKAMEEMEDGYGERNYNMGHGGIRYREDREWDEDRDYDERRRRSSRTGRYI